MNKAQLMAVFVKLFIGGMQFVIFDALKATPVVGLDGKSGTFKRGFFVAFILFCSVLLSFIPYAYLKHNHSAAMNFVSSDITPYGPRCFENSNQKHNRYYTKKFLRF